jgi:hypothetical protein
LAWRSLHTVLQGLAETAVNLSPFSPSPFLLLPFCSFLSYSVLPLFHCVPFFSFHFPSSPSYSFHFPLSHPVLSIFLCTIMFLPFPIVPFCSLHFLLSHSVPSIFHCLILFLPSPIIPFCSSFSHYMSTVPFCSRLYYCTFRFLLSPPVHLVLFCLLVPLHFAISSC